MRRLNQSRSADIGAVYQTRNNDAGKLVEFRNPIYGVPIPKPEEKQELEGEGIKDIIKTIYDKGKRGLNYLENLYTGETGVAIRNALPDSDDTARPSFVGEKHALLQLPNGKYGTANFMGPGTNLMARLKRGDPPRTECDKVAKAHDIRYALARNTDDIRNADNIMLNAVDNIARNKRDNPKNIAQARLIRLKTLGENLGVLRRDAFSGDLSKEIDESEKTYLTGKLGPLAQEGYGRKKGKILPGDALKIKLLKQMVKEKKMKGMGARTNYNGANYDRDLGKSYELAGEGILSGGIPSFLIDSILPKLMLDVGIKPTLVDTEMIKKIVLKSLNVGSSGGNVMEHLSRTLLPILTHLKSQSMSGNTFTLMKGKGMIVIKDPIVKKKLVKSLSKGLKKSFSYYLVKSKNSKMKGKGLNLSGMGWWDDFKSGFVSVFKPASKILGPILSAVGMPEFGIPLAAVGAAL